METLSVQLHIRGQLRDCLVDFDRQGDSFIPMSATAEIEGEVRPVELQGTQELQAIKQARQLCLNH